MCINCCHLLILYFLDFLFTFLILFISVVCGFHSLQTEELDLESSIEMLWDHKFLSIFIIEIFYFSNCKAQFHYARAKGWQLWSFRT